MATRDTRETMLAMDSAVQAGSDGSFIERRSRDRINDAVGLTIVEVGPDAKDGSSAHSDSKLNRSSSVSTLSRFSEIKSGFPAATKIIDSFKKALGTGSVKDKFPAINLTHKVSLSASGLAFADNRLFNQKNTLQMTIHLFPENEQINCLARIVSVNDAPEVGDGEKHTYRVEFTGIAEADRALIKKHVQSILREFDQLADAA